MQWWRLLGTFPKNHPVIFGAGFSAVKASSADYLTQTCLEKKEKVDLRRNFIFFLWGLGSLGGVQYC